MGGLVLVTGASGFLGVHTVRALRARGFEVHGLSRSRPPDACGVWHQVDLFDRQTVRQTLEAIRPSYLVHLAWVTEHGRYWTSPDNLPWVEATLALCREFRELGGRRFVGAGTCAEYTWDERILYGRPVREHDTPREPSHLYGIAKKATFEILAAYCRTAGMSFSWGRVFFPYGPHETRPTLIPSIIRSLRQGRPAACTHGRQVRDFIHAADVGAAFAALVDSEVEGPFNIACGAGWSIAEVATRLGSLMGRPDLIQLGALQARPEEPRRLVADVGRLAGEVGFRPTLSLDDGLRDTVAWWMSQASAA